MMLYVQIFRRYFLPFFLGITFVLGLAADVNAAVIYATFDSGNCGSDFVLSGGNLTLQDTVGSGTWQSCFTDISKSSGKWYWEQTAVTAQSVTGIAQSQTTGNYIGYNSTGWAYFHDNGNYFNANTQTACGASYTAGDVIGHALDLDGNTLTFYKNNVLQCTINITAGTYYAGVSALTAYTGQVYNFGASAFTYSPPAGYNAGFYNDTGGGGTTSTPWIETPGVASFIEKYYNALIAIAASFLGLALFIGSWNGIMKPAASAVKRYGRY